jgi:hypothetical protein
MSILNLTVSQYIVVALLITLWAFIARWVMVGVNNCKSEEVKKLWKKAGIETNSFRTRGSQYTLYEKGAIEQMHDQLIEESMNLIKIGIMLVFMVIGFETIRFILLPMPVSIYVAVLVAGISAVFCWLIVSVQADYFFRITRETKRVREKLSYKKK